MIYCPISNTTNTRKVVPSMTLNRSSSFRNRSSRYREKYQAISSLEKEFDQMFENFLGESLFKNSSPLMKEFFASKKDEMPKLTEGSMALDRQNRTIRTNIGQIKPESISVKIEPATQDNSATTSAGTTESATGCSSQSLRLKTGKHGISVLTISGKEEDSQTGSFSEFSSTRTLPLYISENGMEEQIISKLVTDKLTGNRVLEITLPEEPLKAIEGENTINGPEENRTRDRFKSDIEITLEKSGQRS